jgi:multidrug efflux pump subunit AcrA (membrane-fusion protein)
MYAEVNLTLSRHNAVLALPVMAIDRDSEGAGRVMIVTANNRVETRKISLGLETASSVEVRSGLNLGDTVVLSGRSSLQPGEEVRPKPTTMSPVAN